MADVATLQVNVVQTGADQTTAALLGLSSAADKAGMSTRLTSDQLAAADARYAQLIGSTTNLTAAVDYNTRSMALQQASAIQMDAAMSGLNLTMDVSSAGLGRIRQGLVSLTAQATGTIPVLDRIGSSFLTMGAGSTVAIAVIAGIAAIAEAYKFLTADATKAAAENDKLLASLQGFVTRQGQGAGGEIGGGTAVAQRQADVLATRIADLQATEAALKSSTLAQSRDDYQSQINQLDASIAALKQQYQAKEALIAAGSQEVDRLNQSAYDRQQEQNASAIAQRLKFSADDHQANVDAFRQLAIDQSLYKQYLTLPDTPENSARVAAYASMITQLEDALKPKVTTASGSVPNDSATKAVLDDLSKQLDLMQKVNEQDNIEALQVTATTGALGVQGGVRKLLQAYETDEVETLKAYHDLSGVALADRLAQIAATEQQAIAAAKSQIAIDQQKDSAKLLDTAIKDVTATGAANTKITDAQTKATAAQITATQALHDAIANDLLQAFDSLAKGGTLSLSSLASAFDALARKLESLKDLSDSTKSTLASLNVGLSAFGIGSSSGGFAGVVSGLASGAAIGVGTAGLGALAGVVGGLLNAAQQQQQAAAALKAAGDALAASVKSYAAGASGAGVAGQLAANDATFDAIQQQLRSVITAALKAGDAGALDQAGNDEITAIQAHADASKKIVSDFFASLDAGFNALAGPGGALKQSDAQALKQYESGFTDLNALYQKGLITTQQYTAGVQELTNTYGAATLAAKLTAQEQADATAANLQLAIQSASAYTLAQKQAYDRAALAEQEREEMQKAVDQRAVDAALGVSTANDDATIAYLKAKDAAEQAAQKVQQFADSISNVDSSVGQFNDVYGVTGAPAIGNLVSGYDTTNTSSGVGLNIDLSPYDLTTKAGDDSAIGYLQGLFGGLSQTDPNYATEAKEIQTLIDSIRQLPPELGGTNTSASSLGSSGSATASSFSAVTTGTVTGISNNQADGLLGLVTTSNLYLAAIRQNTQPLLNLGGASNFTATAASVGGVQVIVNLSEQDQLALINLLRKNPQVARAFDNANGINAIRARAGVGTPRT